MGFPWVFLNFSPFRESDPVASTQALVRWYQTGLAPKMGGLIYVECIYTYIYIYIYIVCIYTYIYVDCRYVYYIYIVLNYVHINASMYMDI